MLASGLTLVIAGFVTAVSLSILGMVLAIAGAVGWFREVLPTESLELTPVACKEITVQPSRRTVARIGDLSGSRAWLPIEIYPISAGIKGGIAGGAAMALLAGLYGITSGNGLWYAMNLLVAGLFPGMATETPGQIGAFNLHRFLIAVPIHFAISFLVGLLYGAMLPMLSRRPIVLGGFVVPLLWSGLVYGILTFVNPVMNQHIDWVWFVASQIAFGIVAGLVVAVQERILTYQQAPLSARMGIETGSPIREHQEELNDEI